jgi:NAD(P) transhydrogenase subunit beta
MSRQVLDAAYLVAAVSFILALKGLSAPRTARLGNLLGAAGMAIGIAFTLASGHLGHVTLIAGGMFLGTVLAVPAARLVKMTAIPQMVAIFNGVGGGAAALVAMVDYTHDHGAVGTGSLVAILADVVIGTISFSGSMIAFAKLQELISGRPLTYRGQQVINGLIGLAILALAVAVPLGGGTRALTLLALLALALGTAVVLPIGGADTPVLISLLNAFTGLAVAASGFVLANTVLVVGGTLVGASGTLLTRMMSQAMGRPLMNIMFGAFGSVAAGGAGGGPGTEGRPVRSGTPADIGTMLAYSRRVVFVPGYGLAVAQAQHTIRDLATALEDRGVEVSYAIHPVAGRMPGHMNVLLAEADVPHEQLRDLEQANPGLAATDVALVVGANDVVNPAARDAPGSPIYGMPILEVDQAKAVVFLKRSMRPGFAGIENELLYNGKTTLLFGDAKDSLSKLVTAVKSA